jgi:hypothetical protein
MVAAFSRRGKIQGSTESLPTVLNKAEHGSAGASPYHSEDEDEDEDDFRDKKHSTFNAQHSTSNGRKRG